MSTDAGTSPRFVRVARVAVVVATVAALIVPQARAQEVPAGTITYSTWKALYTISPDGSAKTLRFRRKGWKVAGPVASPDGRRVAFEAFGSGRIKLMVLDLASGDVTTVAGPKFKPGGPVWSHDGTRLAYDGYSKRKSGTYVWSVDGPRRTKVFDDWSWDLPSWSHDDSKLAVSDFEGQAFGVVWYYDFDAGELVRLPVEIDAGAPLWSPVGDELLFSSLIQADPDYYSTLYTVDVMGENLTPLTGEGEHAVGAYWAPDGSTIAFASRPEGGPRLAISLIAPDGTGRVEVVDDNDDAGANVSSTLQLFGYSPDGASLAYEIREYDATTAEPLDVRLWTMNADGSEQADRLADLDTTFLSWAPDSEAIMLCHRQGKKESLRYLLEGSVHEVGAPTCDATWGP